MERHVTLTIGHSPDPDDAFMWWPLGTAGLEGGPPDAAALPPAIDTTPFAYRPIASDIQDLNRRAIERADLDVTAISMHAYGHVRDMYALTDCGASFGDGYGPKVLAPSDAPLPPDGANPESCASWLCERLDAGATLAVPGFETSAYLVLRSMTGRAGARAVSENRIAAMRFDRIIPAVLEGTADLGLVIHEAQVTYAAEGLGLGADLGTWWAHDTGGLPLPLGANAVKLDLEDRFGPGSLRRVTRTLSESIQHALANRAGGLEYARAFATVGGAGGISPQSIDKFVGLYVNDLTSRMGERGRAAVAELLHRGEAMGLIPANGKPRIIGIE